MPSFKSLSSKMLGGIKKKADSSNAGDDESRRSGGSDSAIDIQGDSPEAVASRSVKAFCESGGPGQQPGDEVTLLPPIVESAESSPAAAAECARMIRTFLKKDYWSKPSYQYNALMLARILSDNPGQTFTRNFDSKFVDTLKDILRNGRDLSVRQMLMETLDQYEQQKSWDEGLAGVIEMWKKEKEKAYKAYGGRAPPPPPQMMPGVPFDNHSQNYFARAHNNKRLPEPAELANRLEEARTSAKLLTQLVANTPSTEVLENDLIKEFADRCLSASRSIQGYMAADNPGPDNETMENLIDVNEELQQALNHQKRAMLSARKELGIDGRSQNPSPQPSETSGSHRPPPPVSTGSYGGVPQGSSGSFGGAPSGPSGSFGGAPSQPRRRDDGKGKGKVRQELNPAEYVSPPPGPPPGRPAPDLVSPISADGDDEVNPFRDPQPMGGSSASRGKAAAGSAVGGGRGGGAPALEQPSLDSEPFHPGFGQPTHSYLGRQDSALNKVQMHGAGSGSPAPERRDVTNGGGSSSSRQQQRYDYGEEEDIYGPSSTGRGGFSGKQPAYRY